MLDFVAGLLTWPCVRRMLCRDWCFLTSWYGLESAKFSVSCRFLAFVDVTPVRSFSCCLYRQK